VSQFDADDGVLDRRAQFLAGARSQIPLFAGVVPFGLAAGAFTAAVLGSAGAAVALHAGMFAGRGQMVAMQMAREQSPLVLMAIANLVINLRNMMYGASIARHFMHLSMPWRLFLAFFLVDNVYALSIKRLERDAATRNAITRHYFYLGGGVAVYAVWTLAGVAGALSGTVIPESFGLSFVPNLSFIYILAMNVQRRDDVLCALAAGVTATALAWLPWQGGLFGGVIAGLCVGYLLGNRTSSDEARA
jgi:predicted branched-subunit amino acid permease